MSTYESLRHSKWDCKYHIYAPAMRGAILTIYWMTSYSSLSPTEVEASRFNTRREM
jgi:hypothetical protein